MSRLVIALSAGILAVVLTSGTAFVTLPAAAAPAADADKAAAKDATAKCRAQVKEQARFEEMSLYARHKLAKKCVEDMLAGH
jgi:ribosomal protein L12E/L44/L45/RPP1/RPP2